MPSELHDLIRYNERLLYGRLFKLAWQSLQELVSNKRYVKRIAISNDRIVNIDRENKRVAFQWRDYSDGNRFKVMWLSFEEFIRRFLQHILPERFSKVRYYGLFANRDKTKRLAKCRKALGKPAKPKPVIITWQERFYRLTGVDPTRCPCCGNGEMHIVILLPPSRAPPCSPSRSKP